MSSLCQGDAQAEAQSDTDLTAAGSQHHASAAQGCAGSLVSAMPQAKMGQSGKRTAGAGFQPLLGDAQHYVSAEEVLPSAKEQKQQPELGKQRHN